MKPTTAAGAVLRILIVDDEPKMCRALERALATPEVREALGSSVEAVSVRDAQAALAALDEGEFDVLLTDLRLPGTDGIQLLKTVRERRRDLDVVLMTAYATVETAVEALRLGAFDYVIKPFRMEEMRHILGRIGERRALIRENARLRVEIEQGWQSSRLIGQAPAFRRVLAMAAKAAPTDSTILLLGESGTGKDLLAAEIHRLSPRAGGPFIKATCAAIPEGLLESDLFGHEKGAFTGATASKEGRFELAHGGTIYLDDVGDMTLATQVKLLRVLQEREFERVGSSVTRKVDVRVIAATNRDLETAIAQGRFREDLYYRLNVVPIRMPALRERREDLLPLIGHFLQKSAARTGRPAKDIDREALEYLLEHTWPGNVRELENVIEHASIMAEGPRIGRQDFPAYLVGSGEEGGAMEARREPSAAAAPGLSHEAAEESAGPPFDSLAEAGLSLDEIEKGMILTALQRTGGNQTQAARLLGITRRTLGYRLDKHGIRLNE